MSGEANVVMTTRALCIHGKVRAMMVEPRPDSGRFYEKEFRKAKVEWARWAATFDRVTVEEARKSDLTCAECDANWRKGRK